ncbi:MAG: putative zinc-binding metallopeptidase [Prevotellaceae bacterium]|jgi:substrate import-associated zinc metallohydrolase lipoprotein|nr:putative zinc-binding metallopeptidase [Prevotellaceae bacterium]
MKKAIIYLFALSLLVGAWSCDKDEINSNSIFDNQDTPQNAFDEWLLMNYTYPYNIDFKYKLEDIESSLTYQLAPARLENSVAMAKLIKYLWLEVYDQVGGITFTRTYVPRIIHLIGSPGYNPNGTELLGTAEGGLKITLYKVNKLNISALSINNLNEYYFKTIHHEFAHILHQTKNYPSNFLRISSTDYIGENWSSSTETLSKANELGFVSRYARSSVDEDFVETLAVYVTSTPAQWKAILAAAGTAGMPKIEQKFSIVKDYLTAAWNIDIVALRNAVQERSALIGNLDLRNL